MFRRWLRWFAPLAVAVACCLPAPAQDAQNQPPAPGDDQKQGPDPPALQFVVAILSTILVLLIVCKPSRKS